MENIVIKNCYRCPFSSWNLSEKGDKASHKCNIQKKEKKEIQWKMDVINESYECFKTCPLKENMVTVTLSE